MAPLAWSLVAATFACALIAAPVAPRTGAEAGATPVQLDTNQLAIAADRTRRFLSTETPPARDEIALARQLKGTCTDPMPTPVPFWHDAAIGEPRRFKVLDERRRTYMDAQATLRAVSDHLLLYVEDGVRVAPEAVTSTVETFERVTLPALEATFGPMPSPSRVTVFSGHVPGVGGYFSSSDLVPASISPHSNERVMVYMNSDVHRPGHPSFDGVLAHEVQHFLHFVRHPQQDSWLNEGASELAMALAGHPQTAPVRSYLHRLETPVTGWAIRPSDAVPHYGAASLIVRYLGFRAGGNDRLRAIIETSGTSTQVIDRYFAGPVPARPPGTPAAPSTFDDLFADFLVATVLDDPGIGDGRFAFDHLPTLAERGAPSERMVVGDAIAPATASGALAPYGARVLEVVPTGPPDGGDLELRIDGDATARAVADEPPGGGNFWWAYPADEVNATLSLVVDLRGAAMPALEFDAAWDLEADYDHAGVALSLDGGCTWRTVAGTGTTEANPVGQNPGHALTGRSGDGSAPQWLPMRFDLAAAAGKVAQVRVFQVTDQAFHGPGLAITNLRMTGRGASTGTDAGWRSLGFVETTNAVSVEWASRAIVEGTGATRVEVIPMARGADGRASGTLVVPDFGRTVTRVIVAISPMVPATQLPVDFRVTATRR